MLVKLTEKAKTHSAAAGYFSPLRSNILISDELIGLYRKAKTAIKSTKATRITISYKHTMLIYKEK